MATSVLTSIIKDSAINNILCLKFNVEKIIKMPINVMTYGKDTDRMGELLMLGGSVADVSHLSKECSAIIYENKMYLFPE